MRLKTQTCHKAERRIEICFGNRYIQFCCGKSQFCLTDVRTVGKQLGGNPCKDWISSHVVKSCGISKYWLRKSSDQKINPVLCLNNLLLDLKLQVFCIQQLCLKAVYGQLRDFCCFLFQLHQLKGVGLQINILLNSRKQIIKSNQFIISARDLRNDIGDHEAFSLNG
jgi:hypothetical protein